MFEATGVVDSIYLKYVAEFVMESGAQMFDALGVLIDGIQGLVGTAIDDMLALALKADNIGMEGFASVLRNVGDGLATSMTVIIPGLKKSFDEVATKVDNVFAGSIKVSAYSKNILDGVGNLDDEAKKLLEVARSGDMSADELTELADLLRTKGDTAIDDVARQLDEVAVGMGNLVSSASDYATKVANKTDVLGTYPASASASDIVRGELKTAGIPNPPYKNAAHHIVPWNDPRALDARNILDDFGIDYNSASNGVFLPMEVNQYTGDAVLHVGSHSADYVNAITNSLEEVVAAGGTKADILSALNKMREGLLNGTLKLNN